MYMLLLILVAVLGQQSCNAATIKTSLSEIDFITGPLENETGKYHYPDNSQKNVYYHCRYCEDRAVSDSTYDHMQQYDCLKHYLEPNSFEKNLSKWEYKNHKYPLCNTGSVPVCGPLPFNNSNAAWKCDPGYSNVIHSVYFSCILVCNYTKKVIVGAYCNESSQWNVYKETTDSCQLPAVESGPVSNSESPLDVMRIVGISVGVFCIVAVILCVVHCVWCRQKRHTSSNIQEPAEDVDQTKPLVRMRIAPKSKSLDSSVGACSLSLNDTGISASDSSARNSEELHLLVDESNDSGVGGNDAHASNRSVNDGTNSRVPNRDMTASTTNDIGVGTDGTDSLQGGENITDKQGGDRSNCYWDGLQGGASRPSCKYDHGRNEPTGTNNEGVKSKRHSKESNASGGSPERVCPSVRVFHPNNAGDMTCSALQENDDSVYSVPQGSSFFVVPRPSEYISQFEVKRKGDGQPYRGKPICVQMRFYLIHSVPSAVQGDEGLYIWTIVLNNGEKIEGCFEICIGKPVLGERMEPLGATCETRDKLINSAKVSNDMSRDDTTSGQQLDGGQIANMNNLSCSDRDLSLQVYGNDLNNRENNLNNQASRNISGSTEQGLNIQSVESNTTISNSIQPKFDDKSLKSKHDIGEEKSEIGTQLDIAELLDDISCGSAGASNENILNESENHALMVKTPVGDPLDNMTRHFNALDPTSFNESAERMLMNTGSLDCCLDDIPSLNPATINQEMPSGERPEPTGTSVECRHVEHRQSLISNDSSDERHDTPVKEVVPSNQDSPPANVVENENHRATVEGNSLMQRDEGNRNRLPYNLLNPGSQDGGIELQENNQKCTTKMEHVEDSYFLQRLGHLADPRDFYGTNLSWFGLGHYYGMKTEFLRALEYHFKGKINEGPTIIVLNELQTSRDFYVGDVVLYFTRQTSRRRDIVDICVDECKDHKKCGYCTNLKQNMKGPNVAS